MKRHADVCDVAIVGSGFGGSVSALRLAEKGFDVLVLEKGRRLAPADLQAARRSLRRFVWQPGLGLHGFFWQRALAHIGVIGASAVGGGSVVWGAVLLEPPDSFFDDPGWHGAGAALRQELAEHYATAARMLGRVTNPHLDAQDEALRKAAIATGAGDTFGPVPLAIYFGEGPGRRSADPFFAGIGPAREGCRLCGGCLAGCPYGAKNTLDLNYLHLAQHHGARVAPEREVRSIAPLPGGGYELRTAHPWDRRRRGVVRASQVIVAAGVLGTVELLLRCRDELGTLPRLSRQLGRHVRTNSESVTGILAPPGVDLLRGPSISSHFHPDPVTHVTQNRFRGGGRVLRWQLGPLVDGEDPRRRARDTLRTMALAPLAQLRIALARGFEQRYTALTIMQHAEQELELALGRSRLPPFRRVLVSRSADGSVPRSYLPVANEVTRAYARAIGGTPLNLLGESLGGRSITAHILGGAVIADDPGHGVVDRRGQVHGHPGLFVVDASVIPANPGVNPSLTIAAIAEWFAAAWPGGRASARATP